MTCSVKVKRLVPEQREMASWPFVLSQHRPTALSVWFLSSMTSSSRDAPTHIDYSPPSGDIVSRTTTFGETRIRKGVFLELSHAAISRGGAQSIDMFWDFRTNANTV